MARGRSCASHIVCLMAFLTWLMGGALLGMTMWMLGTSPAVKRFFTGTLYFSYVLLTLGSLMFITGLFGWIGSYKRGGCLMKMFLVLSVLTIASEIGGIVALNILRMKMADILETGWNEVNQPSKNLVQESFSCCGFRGPREFAHTSDPIDDSCYAQQITSKNGDSGLDSGSSTTQILEVRRLNRNGCKEKLVEWFYNYKVIWIVALGLILLFQVTSILMSVYVLNQRKRAENGSSTQSLPIVQSYL